MTKHDFKIIDAIDLDKISDYALEVEKDKVFSDIITHILEVCVKNAKIGKKSATFSITNSDSITFESYFKNISLEYVYPDIRYLLTKYHYKVELNNENEFTVSWNKNKIPNSIKSNRNKKLNSYRLLRSLNKITGRGSGGG